ncbi:hypothetical protein ACH4Y0_03080 [Streptomyces sp. NPDC020707]|uniref:hypothetical protein n=1 Tax=Streptomyces sp. NPDC020707 TaxID=3365084 RepID=UPI0037964829
MARDEGTFLICSSWTADALVRSGSLNQVRELFEGLLSWFTGFVLMAEEDGLATGHQLGNHPQAFRSIRLAGSGPLLHQLNGKGATVMAA